MSGLFDPTKRTQFIRTKNDLLANYHAIFQNIPQQYMTRRAYIVMNAITGTVITDIMYSRLPDIFCPLYEKTGDRDNLYLLCDTTDPLFNPNPVAYTVYSGDRLALGGYTDGYLEMIIDPADPTRKRTNRKYQVLSSNYLGRMVASTKTQPLQLIGKDLFYQSYGQNVLGTTAPSGNLAFLSTITFSYIHSGNDWEGTASPYIPEGISQDFIDQLNADGGSIKIDVERKVVLAPVIPPVVTSATLVDTSNNTVNDTSGNAVNTTTTSVVSKKQLDELNARIDMLQKQINKEAKKEAEKAKQNPATSTNEGVE